MSKAKDAEVRQFKEKILSVMGDENHSSKFIGQQLGISSQRARVILEEMADYGILKRVRTSRYISYQLPPTGEDVVKPHYQPPFKPMGVHDLAKFQRLCEGARNNERGYV